MKRPRKNKSPLRNSLYRWVPYKRQCGDGLSATGSSGTAAGSTSAGGISKASRGTPEHTKTAKSLYRIGRPALGAWRPQARFFFSDGRLDIKIMITIFTMILVSHGPYTILKLFVFQAGFGCGGFLLTVPSLTICHIVRILHAK